MKPTSEQSERATTRVEPCVCPYCRYVVTAHSMLQGDGGPAAADASLCVNCGGLCVFTETLGLRLPTREEIALLDAEPGLMGFIDDVQTMIRNAPRVGGH